MTMTWLSLIKIELENLDLQDPKFRGLEPNTRLDTARDQIVGDAADDIRKLYVLALHWDKTACETATAARYLAREDQPEQLRKVAELQRKSEILMDILWVSLKDSFGLWDKPAVGLRKGWKIVWYEQEGLPIADILGGLLGR